MVKSQINKYIELVKLIEFLSHLKMLFPMDSFENKGYSSCTYHEHKNSTSTRPWIVTLNFSKNKSTLGLQYIFLKENKQISFRCLWNQTWTLSSEEQNLWENKRKDVSGIVQIPKEEKDTSHLARIPTRNKDTCIWDNENLNETQKQ